MVLPVSIFSFVLIGWISTFLSFINLPSSLITIFNNLLGHSLFVLLGVIIAPKYKFGVALVLAIIMVAIITLSIFFIIEDYLRLEDIVPEEDANIIDPMKNLMEIEIIGKILAILGAGYVTIMVKKHEKKFQNI